MNPLDLSWAMDELRKNLAHTLEAPNSPLCDCNAATNPPSYAGKRLDHHCDCRAVVAAGVVLGDESKTLHARLCNPDAHRSEATS